jgi:hypothetical protein
MLRKVALSSDWGDANMEIEFSSEESSSEVLHRDVTQHTDIPCTQGCRSGKDTSTYLLSYGFLIGVCIQNMDPDPDPGVKIGLQFRKKYEEIS